MKQGKIWFVIQITTAVCCVIAGISVGVLGILSILGKVDVKYIFVGLFILLFLSSISCVIAAWDLRKINKLEETCNESDSKQDLSSNER